MKNTCLNLLLVCLLTFSCCKKSTTSSYIANTATPSIVGKWVMTGFSGVGSTYKDTALLFIQYDAYDNTTKTLKSAYSNFSLTGTIYFDTLFYQFITETWTFKADGTYAIEEFYTTGPSWTGPLDTTAYTFTGPWEYNNNGQVNTGFILQGNPLFADENLISNLTGYSTIYTTFNIQLVNSSTLVINHGDTSVNYGNTYRNSHTVTFTKQ